jgi:hypothetical protein
LLRVNGLVVSLVSERTGAVEGRSGRDLAEPKTWRAVRRARFQRGSSKKTRISSP